MIPASSDERQQEHSQAESLRHSRHINENNVLCNRNISKDMISNSEVALVVSTGLGLSDTWDISHKKAYHW